jgi:hypothetical protein
LSRFFYFIQVLLFYPGSFILSRFPFP